MIIHDIQLPPEYTFPIDDWKLIHARFEPHLLAQTETIFALGNGYLGMRGTFEEGTPVFQKGTFVNAFYESWPIVYGEEAYGFAKTGQTIVNVTDSQVIKLYVDDEPFYLPTASLLQYERRLDMQAGTLDREVLWETPSGKHVSIHSRRLVSFPERHLAAISYEVTVLKWSRYLQQLEAWFGQQMGSDWTTDVAAMQALLQRGDDIYQMMQVTGEEGISLDDYITWQKATLLDMVYLQQDGFDDVDASVPLERQQESFGFLKSLLNRDYTFRNNDEARDFFTRLTSLYKNFNYSPAASPAYQQYQHEIEELAAQYAGFRS